jgi:integrase/recombinase XerD
LPRKDAAIRHTLTDADVRALFDGCRRLPNPRQRALATAVLSVLAHGALRRAELCDLRVEDVNLTEQSVFVRSGKGAKSRRLFVCAEAMAAIREWLALRETDTKHPYLFSLDRNRRLHFQGIHALMESLAAASGMAGNPACKPHSLRHWSLTNLVRNGASLRDVMAFSGHADLQTLQRYLHSSEEQLRKIAELTALTPVPASSPVRQVAWPETARERRRIPTR